jgi:hypothetical protein
MNDYNGISKAVRNELESITNKEICESKTKQKPEEPNFWQKLRVNIYQLLNKAPK